MTDEQTINKRYNKASNWVVGILGAGMLACTVVGITNVSKFMFKERSQEFKEYFANTAEYDKIAGPVYDSHNLVCSINQLGTNSIGRTKYNLESVVAKAKEVETYFVQRQTQLKTKIATFEKTRIYQDYAKEQNQAMRTFSYSMGGTTLLFLLGLAVSGVMLHNQKRKLEELSQSSTKTN